MYLKKKKDKKLLHGIDNWKKVWGIKNYHVYSNLIQYYGIE